MAPFTPSIKMWSYPDTLYRYGNMHVNASYEWYDVIGIQWQVGKEASNRLLWIRDDGCMMLSALTNTLNLVHCIMFYPHVFRRCSTYKNCRGIHVNFCLVSTTATVTTRKRGQGTAQCIVRCIKYRLCSPCRSWHLTGNRVQASWAEWEIRWGQWQTQYEGWRAGRRSSQSCKTT